MGTNAQRLEVELEGGGGLLPGTRARSADSTGI